MVALLNAPFAPLDNARRDASRIEAVMWVIKDILVGVVDNGLDNQGARGSALGGCVV